MFKVGSQLPEGWHWKPLDSIVILDNESLGSDTPLSYSFSYIDISSVTTGRVSIPPEKMKFRDAPSRARKRVKSGDILMATVRPNLQAFAVFNEPGSDYIASTGFAVLTPRENNSPGFIYNSLLADYVGRQIENNTSGTNYPAIACSKVSALNIATPPPTEQRTIATILDSIDNAIRHTEQMIEKLQRVKIGLLHDLLTCGLDENGELRDPVRHPEQFKDSPLGRIPSAWDTLTLAGISDFITSGSRGWAQYYASDGPLFLRIGNLTREHINLRLDDIVHVAPPRGSEGARTRVVPGDLMVSITADLGIIGCAPEGIGEAYVNQHVALARLNSDVNSRWVAHYLASPMYQHRFQYSNDAGAKAGMNLTSVGNLVVAIPGAEESELAVEILDKNDEEIATLKVGLRKHLLLKQGLMRDLLTGDVRVSEGISAI